MQSWGRSREIEKPKGKPKPVVTITVWVNPMTVTSPNGRYRALLAGTDYDGYGDTITQAVTDMFERMLEGTVKTVTDLIAAGKI